MRALAALAVLAVAVPSPAFAQEASVSPSPTATNTETPGGCALVRVDTSARVIRVGETVTLNVVTSEPTRIEVRRRYPSPGVRVGFVEKSGPNGATFTYRLGESHLFDVTVGVRCGRPPEPVLVEVQPSVSLAATRNGVRLYTFTGRVVPARGQRVTLWRVEADGRRVLTSTSTLAPDGTYRFVRRFTGSGRFGFQVDVAATQHNAAGRSSVRPTVIY